MQSSREQYFEQTIHDVVLAAGLRFAAANGWELTRRPFSIEKLTRKPPDFLRFGPELDMGVLDHTQRFREDGRPVALVAHPYGEPRERAERLAQQLGLQVICCARSSWWLPGRSTMLVFTAPGTPVVMPTEAEIEANKRAHGAWSAECERRRLARELGEERPRS
jgi:hypothetical protein